MATLPEPKEKFPCIFPIYALQRRLTWSSSVSKDVQDKLNEQEKHLLKLPSETAQNGLYCEVYDNAGLEVIR